MPLKPEGYRFKVPFNEATQLAVESDVRISSVSVGKVKSIELAPDNGLAVATIEIDSRYAPIPADTRAMLRQKTLLGETYVELTPGQTGTGRSCRKAATLPKAQVAARSSSTRSSAPSTPRTRAAFQIWMQAAARAAGPRRRPLGRDRRARAASPRTPTGCCACSTPSSRAVQQLVRNSGEVFQALSERQGQLRGLIQNSDTVFATTARRNQDLEDTVPVLPTFQRRVTPHARPGSTASRGTPTRWCSSCGPRRASSARPWSLPRRPRPT